MCNVVKVTVVAMVNVLRIGLVAFLARLKCRKDYAAKRFPVFRIEIFGSVFVPAEMDFVGHNLDSHRSVHESHIKKNATRGGTLRIA